MFLKQDTATLSSKKRTVDLGISFLNVLDLTEIVQKLHEKQQILAKVCAVRLLWIILSSFLPLECQVLPIYRMKVNLWLLNSMGQSL